jgi:hypothetical protein
MHLRKFLNHKKDYLSELQPSQVVQDLEHIPHDHISHPHSSSIQKVFSPRPLQQKGLYPSSTLFYYKDKNPESSDIIWDLGSSTRPILQLTMTYLPYELLQVIFDLLDTKTLLNLTLTNRPLNDPASRSLYRDIIVNPDRKRPQKGDKELQTLRFPFANPHNGKVPFPAFERRPHLRDAVQRVCIYSPSEYSCRSKRGMGK